MSDGRTWEVQYGSHTLNLTWEEYRTLWRTALEDAPAALVLAAQYLVEQEARIAREGTP